jgi:hypothetical protein
LTLGVVLGLMALVACICLAAALSRFRLFRIASLLID